MSRTDETLLAQRKIYNQIVAILTDYEDGQYASQQALIDDMYYLLVEIQNSWENVLTISE